MSLIILDRDGVINKDSASFIKSAKEWIPYDYAAHAISILNEHSSRVCIATNQSGIARGLFSHEDLQQIHAAMAYHLSSRGARIDRLLYCPHGPSDNCSCRKPSPGMYLQLCEEYSHATTDTFIIGDSTRDLLPASTIGAKPILVLTGNGIQTSRDPKLPSNTLIFETLLEAAYYLRDLARLTNEE